MSSSTLSTVRQYSATGRCVAVRATPDTHRHIERIYGAPANGSSLPTDSFQLLSESDEWRLLEGDVELARRPQRQVALEDLEATICNRLLADRSHLVTIHGATLVTPAGTLFITGPSGAGKTTLSLALTRGGWRLLADDLAFVHADTNEVEPMIRCFHLDAASRHLLTGVGIRAVANADEILTPRDLGFTGGRVAAPRWFLSLLPGAGPEPAIQETTQAAALGVLSQEGGRGDAPWPQALTTLGRLIGDARCYRMTRGELSRMVEAVQRIVGDAPHPKTNCCPPPT